MTAPAPNNPSVLPADAKCPRCGYEFGIAGQTRCSECGLTIDARAIRAIEVRKVAGRKLAVAMGINGVIAIVLLSMAATVDQSMVIVMLVLGVSLCAGWGVSQLAPRWERSLWLNAWARSHLLFFAHWVMLIIVPALAGDPLGLLLPWGCLALVSLIGAPIYFRSLKERHFLTASTAAWAFGPLQALAAFVSIAFPVVFFGRVIFSIGC